VLVQGSYIKTHDGFREKILVEDLAALEKLSEEKILDEIKARYLLGYSWTFVGDVLIFVNPNHKSKPNYDRKVC
jgi:myosin-3